MKKHLKNIKTDQQAEKILKQDLSPYIHSDNFKPIQFELQSQNQNVTIKISEELLKALKHKAHKEGVHYHKLVRKALEESLQ